MCTNMYTMFTLNMELQIISFNTQSMASTDASNFRGILTSFVRLWLQPIFICLLCEHFRTGGNLILIESSHRMAMIGNDMFPLFLATRLTNMRLWLLHIIRENNCEERMEHHCWMYSYISSMANAGVYSERFCNHFYSWMKRVAKCNC